MFPKTVEPAGVGPDSVSFVISVLINAAGVGSYDYARIYVKDVENNFLCKFCIGKIQDRPPETGRF
jgi:hypothetical protein